MQALLAQLTTAGLPFTVVAFVVPAFFVALAALVAAEVRGAWQRTHAAARTPR